MENKIYVRGICLDIEDILEGGIYCEDLRILDKDEMLKEVNENWELAEYYEDLNKNKDFSDLSDTKKINLFIEYYKGDDVQFVRKCKSEKEAIKLVNEIKENTKEALSLLEGVQ